MATDVPPSEANERLAARRRSADLLDAEQARRVAADQEASEYAQLEREANQRRASGALDAEQARRVAEEAAAGEAAAAERAANQAAAGEAVEAERLRRLSLDQAADQAAAQEREDNRRASIRLMDEEQQRRVAEGAQPADADPAAAAARAEAAAAVATLPVDDGTAAGAGAEGAAYTASDAATADVAALLAADAEDESLARYKQQLLGAAAAGDLGDTSDPRRVIIQEFAVQFEEDVPDVVFDLSTEAGIQQLAATPFVIKEGANFRFRIRFRVQHEIVTGLRYLYRRKKGPFTDSDSIMLGSYAPQSAPHEFFYPARGWDTAPKGMMARGRINVTDRLMDSDGNEHLSFGYTFNIAKRWS